MVKHRWTAAFLSLVAAAAMAQQRLLPLDPLTPGEIAKAEDLARGDARMKELAPNGRKIYVQFISAKVPGVDGRIPDEPVNRYADVLLHNDDRRFGARALVALTNGKVVDVVRVPEHLVDLGRSDIEIAAGLALRDDRVLALLGPTARRFRVPSGPLNREQMNEDVVMCVRTIGGVGLDPCATDRCVVLFFRSAGRFVAMNQVTVDLSQQRVFVTGSQR